MDRAASPEGEASPDRAGSARSGYVDIDAAPAPEIYVERLDATSTHAVHRALAARSLELLGLRSGARVLEVGCGTGAHVLEMALCVGPDGEAVGVDRSRVMIETCEQRHASGPPLPARFVRTDATLLPFGNGVFDACRVMRTLLHISEAQVAIAEMARVTRRGGTIVMVEPDYGSIEIEGADPAITRRMIAARVAHFAQGRAGVWIAGWALRAGLRVQAHESLWMEAPWSPRREDRYRRKYAVPAVVQKRVTTDEAERWIESVRVAATDGRFKHRMQMRLVAVVRT